MSIKFLEKNKKLSESLLWELQERAYKQFGPQAWTAKGVPAYLTSNPFTAKNLAQVVIGYLRDCLASQAKTPIDLKFPVYIFDLGAGSGRLAYLFLNYFLPVIQLLFPKELKVRYVMTDISEKNIEFWKQHRYLKKYMDDGVLDFAFYSDRQTEPIKLINSQTEIKQVENPLILICTYFFDTIVQDLYRIEKGELFEGRVSLSVDDTVKVDDKDPDIINHIKTHYDFLPLKNGEVKVPCFDETFQGYKKYEDLTFLFPTGAIRTLEYFSALSKNRTFVLSGDQGISKEDQLKRERAFDISLHGAFSFPVDYMALARYYSLKGGASFLTRFPEPVFTVMAGVLGGGKERFPETAQAFETHIDAFEPKDYWKLIDQAPKERLSLEYIFLLIKLGAFDPANVNYFFEEIRDKIRTSKEAEKEALPALIEEVYKQFYPIAPQDGLFVSNLGVLLFDRKFYVEALKYFEYSLDITGDSPDTYKNMAACFQGLNDHQNAVKCLKKVNSLQKGSAT